MKVTLEKDYRKYYTLEELDQAKEVIKFEKENDEGTIKSWAVYAANEALKHIDRYESVCEEQILTAQATTSRNSRAWNEYGDNTGHMDVWIEFTAFTGSRFITGGACLTDIWQTGATEYAHHMYYRVFEEVK
jgi:hypothetical protein